MRLPLLKTGVVYGVTNSASSTPAAPDVEFQLTTERWLDGYAQVYRKSIADTIDGSNEYTGQKITASDVTIEKQADNVNLAQKHKLQQVVSESSLPGSLVSTMRRRLQEEPQPATLNVGIRLKNPDDIAPVKVLLQTGQRRTEFSQKLVANLTVNGLSEEEVSGITLTVPSTNVPVSVPNIMRHLEAFGAAAEAHNGSRYVSLLITTDMHRDLFVSNGDLLGIF